MMTGQAKCSLNLTLPFRDYLFIGGTSSHGSPFSKYMANKEVYKWYSEAFIPTPFQICLMDNICFCQSDTHVGSNCQPCACFAVSSPIHKSYNYLISYICKVIINDAVLKH